MSVTSTEVETPALRLLVIEDEALVAMLIEDALTLHGHYVVGVADSAARALEIASGDTPELALCDIRLSDGETGTSAAETLAARGVPCLYLSAHCPETSEHPLILGCLRKPFHTASIGKAIVAAYQAAHGQEPADLPPGMFLYR